MLKFMYCKTCGRELGINDTICNDCKTPRPIVYNVYKGKDNSSGCLTFALLGLLFFWFPILNIIFQLTAFIKCIKGFKKNTKMKKTVLAFIITLIAIAILVFAVYKIISDDLISQLLKQYQRK